MNVYEAIINRRSVRQFKPDMVPDKMVEKLLEAARRAPSGGNIQPWFFYVVKDQAKREQLSRAAMGQRSVAEAPVCLVVCAEPALSASKYHERGVELYCLQDTAAAVQNILLAAVEQGLGSCWVGAFDEEKVRHALEMPLGRRPVTLIPIGYSAKEMTAFVGRKDLAEVSQWI